ncbi:MAG: ABC transporter permease [Xanthobacteraceae bacterium]
MTESPPIRRGTAPHERGFGILRVLRSIIQHRALVWEMARREMTDMHAGQTAGIVWLVVHPLVLFAVYAFLFTVVFKVRIGDRGPSDYLIYLFSGLVPWLLTQDVLARTAPVFIANITIVKSVMFPSEVLVAKTLSSSVTVQFVLFAAVVIYIVIARQAVPATFLLLPALFFLHLMLLWGLALLLGAMTPYFRDIPELVRVFLTINIYLIPIMYLPDMVPGPLRFVLVINPFSSLIWCYQDVLYFGSIVHPGAWVALAAISMGSLAVGSYVFVRLRHHFASVL